MSLPPDIERLSEGSTLHSKSPEKVNPSRAKLGSFAFSALSQKIEQDNTILKTRSLAGHFFKALVKTSKFLVVAIKKSTSSIKAKSIHVRMSLVRLKKAFSALNPNMKRFSLKHSLVFFAGAASLILNIKLKSQGTSSSSALNNTAFAVIGAMGLLANAYSLVNFLMKMIPILKLYIASRNNPESLSPSDKAKLQSELSISFAVKNVSEFLFILFSGMTKVIRIIGLFVPGYSTALLSLSLVESVFSVIFETVQLISALKSPEMSKKEKVMQASLLALNVLVSVGLFCQIIVSVLAPHASIAVTTLFALLKVLYVIFSSTNLVKELKANMKKQREIAPTEKQKNISVERTEQINLQDIHNGSLDTH